MKIKRTQNRVAESRLTLSAVMVYAIAVWLAGGLLQQQLWPQLVCFLLSTYLMVVLNNSNALIRVYSRTISCSFIILTCAANFLFSSFAGAFFTLCITAFYVILFHTYQDKQAVGYTFYAFVCLGLASAAFVKVLWIVPIFWGCMFVYLSSLSWRTLAASIIGLITPYWLFVPIIIYQGQRHVLMAHLAKLADIQPAIDYSHLTTPQVLTALFTALLAITGIVHFWRNSSADRIRIRQLYGFFTLMTVLSNVAFFVLPQHFDILLGLLIINTAPLIGHFVTLTRTRYTNIAFYVICVTALILTAINLWMPSLSF